MSTRSVIGRKTRNGFNGRYHHWDGYPSGLGKTLYNLYNGRFKKNLDNMLKVLIDDHPAGWSNINDKNFKKKPRYSNHRDADRPECFCHGDRGEPGFLHTHKTAAGSGCEYAYAFEMKTREKGKGRKEPVMHVYSSYRLDGEKMIGFFGCGDEKAIWVPIGLVFLNDPEPNWESIKEDNNFSLHGFITKILTERGILCP